MKHVSPEKLENLVSLLNSLKTLDGLRENKPGVFYRKSKAFLHFHEDGDFVFADIKLDGRNFERLPASTRKQQQDLLKKVRQAL